MAPITECRAPCQAGLTLSGTRSWLQGMGMLTLGVGQEARKAGLLAAGSRA